MAQRRPYGQLVAESSTVTTYFLHADVAFATWQLGRDQKRRPSRTISFFGAVGTQLPRVGVEASLRIRRWRSTAGHTSECMPVSSTPTVTRSSRVRYAPARLRGRSIHRWQQHPVPGGRHSRIDSRSHVWDLTPNTEIRKNVVVRVGVNNVADARYFIGRATSYPGPGSIPADGRGVQVSLGLRY